MRTVALHITRRNCGGEDNAVLREAHGRQNPQAQPVNTEFSLKDRCESNYTYDRN